MTALANLQPTEGVGISATPLQPTTYEACIINDSIIMIGGVCLRKMLSTKLQHNGVRTFSAYPFAFLIIAETAISEYHHPRFLANIMLKSQ